MKFTLLFIFITIWGRLFYSQEYQYAVISDIKVSTLNSVTQLQQIVDNINLNDSIKFVVVIGNATLNGKDEEFQLVKKVLDKLNVDYYPVSGFNDMKLNASGGTMAKDLWEDDKFALEVGSTAKHIGINDFSPRRNKGHFSVEDLLWLDTVVTNAVEGEEMYYYSSVQLNEKNIGNWYEVQNRLSNKNWKAVFYPALQNRINTQTMPRVVELKPSLTKAGSWNYTLVDNNTDSLLFYEISEDSLQYPWGAFAKTDTTYIMQIDSSKFINYDADLIWQKELQKEMYAPVLVTEDKIFTSSFNGEINCFDPEGNLLWKHNLDRTVLNGFAREKDLLLIGTYEGDLFSINVNTGQVVQVIGIGEPVTSQLVIADVHYNDNDTKGVIAATAEGNVFFYEIYTFELIWSNNSSKEMIETKPIALKDKIIFTSRDGSVFNIDLNSGVLNWKWAARNSSYLSSPVVNDKYVFISSTDKYITAIDLLQGTTAWHKNEYTSYESLNLSDDKKRLLIKSLSDYFVIADAGSGKVDKKIKAGFGFDADPSPILSINDQYLFGAGNGFIYLIDKNYNCSPLLYLGNARITTLQLMGENNIAAANCDGRIVLFKLKQD